MDHPDAEPIAELLDERRYLLDVAYRMLGSPGEAESVVDETYRRWYGLSDTGTQADHRSPTLACADRGRNLSWPARPHLPGR